MTDFSVVIPLFNGAPTIVRALRSVLAQSVPAFEIIVVDDGSTDDGPGLVSEQFPEVRLSRQANAGAGAARNHGIDLARAPWIAFLDADDVWAPDHLAELARIRTRCPSAALIATDHVETTDGHPPARWRSPRLGRRIRQIDYFSRAAWTIGIVWTSSAAARTVALRSSGGFTRDSNGEDLAAWARLALHHPVAISRSVTAAYLRRPDSLSAQLAARRSVPIRPDDPRPSSPSQRVVLAALETGEHTVPRASLERYLDGRLGAGWRRLFLHGEREQALVLLGWFYRPWGSRAWGLRFVSLVPPWSRRALLGVRARLRSRGRRSVR